MYQTGCRNAENIQLTHNIIESTLPPTFDGFTILKISDLHVEMNPSIVERLTILLPSLCYDLCVITGDYRARSCGPYEAALEGVAKLCSFLKEPVYGVLGDHDTIYMLPGLEKLGIRMLMNESVEIMRGEDAIYLAGIDDAHRFQAADISKAVARIPHSAFSILLSHTPEVYRQ